MADNDAPAAPALEDQLLTVDELSAYVKLKVGSIHNMVSRREIPFVKAGRLLRFRKSEIDAWLQSHRVAEEEVA